MALDVGDDVTHRTEQLADPLEEAHRVASDADVAVGQQGVCPGGGIGHRGEHVMVDGPAAAAARHLDGRRRHVHTERRDPPVGQRGRQPPRPAPDVDRGSEAALE
jgi:hypothetical protein